MKIKTILSSQIIHKQVASWIWPRATITPSAALASRYRPLGGTTCPKDTIGCIKIRKENLHVKNLQEAGG